MTPIEELPLWAEILVSLFLLGVGRHTDRMPGLVRFKTFYERITHPRSARRLGRSQS